MCKASVKIRGMSIFFVWASFILPYQLWSFCEMGYYQRDLKTKSLCISPYPIMLKQTHKCCMIFPVEILIKSSQLPCMEWRFSWLKRFLWRDYRKDEILEIQITRYRFFFFSCALMVGNVNCFSWWGLVCNLNISGKHLIFQF